MGLLSSGGRAIKAGSLCRLAHAGACLYVRLLGGGHPPGLGRGLGCLGRTQVKHIHVPVCICSNVRRFEIQSTEGGGGNFRAKSNSLWEISRTPPVECITPRQSSQCVLLVYQNVAENPEFRVGNFAGNLKREISHAKLKCHETPPPPCSLGL